MAGVKSTIGVFRDLTWNKDGGILLATLQPGEGDEGPRIGDRVFVHYIGLLEDGTVFETTRNRKEPFQFTIGRAEVVMAWDCAIANMRKGETARIVCQPEYAYGAKGATRHPAVPHNTAVIFEVELLDWKGVDLSPAQDGGIIKRLEKQGQRVATPVDGAVVTIRYEGWHRGKEVERRKVTYTQGEGDEEGVIAGLELAARHMKKGERDRLTLSPQYAFGEGGSAELGVPPLATLVYDVQMLHFKLPVDPLDMDVDEKLEACHCFKEKGTAYFKKGRYERALSYYKKIVAYLEEEEEDLCCGRHGNQVEEDRYQLLLAAHLNLALCHLKLHSVTEAEAECDRVLDMDAHCVKALFRRGQARLSRDEFDKAAEDFRHVLKVDPCNKAARNQLSVCRRGHSQAYAKEKQLCSSMLADLSAGSPNAVGDPALTYQTELNPYRMSDSETAPEW